MHFKKIILVGLLSMAPTAQAVELDCKYTFSFDVIKGQEEALRDDLKKWLKDCEAKKNCDSPEQKVEADLEKMTMTYQKPFGAKKCEATAKFVCPLKTKGIVNSKTVTYYNKGEEVGHYKCTADGKMTSEKKKKSKTSKK